MDTLKYYWNKIKKNVIAGWKVFKTLPIVLPILRLLYSRKAAIAVFVTGVLFDWFPFLTETAAIEGLVLDGVTRLTIFVVVWVVTAMGYALEDVAEKQGKAAAAHTNGGDTEAKSQQAISEVRLRKAAG